MSSVMLKSSELEFLLIGVNGAGVGQPEVDNPAEVLWCPFVLRFIHDLWCGTLTTSDIFNLAPMAKWRCVCSSHVQITSRKLLQATFFIKLPPISSTIFVFHKEEPTYRKFTNLSRFCWRKKLCSSLHTLLRRSLPNMLPSLLCSNIPSTEHCIKVGAPRSRK